MTTIKHPHRGLIEAACRTIDGADDAPTLEQLAARAGLSAFHFQRVFKAHVGLSPKQYALARRDERARDALADGKEVTRAIFDAGYASSSRFYERAARTLGMKPSKYKDGAGEMVRFAVARCSLGRVLVAATARGVCMIALGDDERALERDLRARFPRADVSRADSKMASIVDRVVSLVEAPERGAFLPLDVRGTAFQQRVWNALRDLAPGETATYSAIARRIGRPRAARAVASACAQNPVALVVPCHRVVREDGGLGGYRWGVDRKRALLDRESNGKTGRRQG